jgi:uncharacterized protein (TIGR02118 family)
MVKLIYLINRLPHLSVEAFQDYWFNTHGPIAGAIKGKKRYIQCHTLPETYANGQPHFDGAAQLWWDSPEAMQADSGTDEVRAALEDEKNFIDHSRVSMFVTEEIVEVDNLAPGQPAVKLIAAIKRKGDMSAEDFATYWGQTHAPLARKVPNLLKYVRCLTVSGVGNAEPEFAGAAELYFSDLGQLGAAFASPEGKAVAEDTPNMADVAAARTLITTEKVIVAW